MKKSKQIAILNEMQGILSARGINVYNIVNYMDIFPQLKAGDFLLKFNWRTITVKQHNPGGIDEILFTISYKKIIQIAMAIARV